jgi:uncharacterized protein
VALTMATKHGSTTFFFLVALGSTWVLQLPAVLAKYGVIPGGVETYLLPAALGGFGPLVAAILAARREGGRSAVKALFRPPRAHKVGMHWYAVALLIFAAIHVVGVATFGLLGGTGARWLYLPENPPQVAAMLLIPIAEEPGWRGFALPRLQRRAAPLGASLILGVLWAAWHVMMFILQGFTPLAFAVAVVSIAVGSVVFSWLYNRTGGSLLVAVVAHAGLHLNNPTHALPAALTPYVVYTVAICCAACVLVIFDRRAWRRTVPSPDGAERHE